MASDEDMRAEFAMTEDGLLAYAATFLTMLIPGRSCEIDDYKIHQHWECIKLLESKANIDTDEIDSRIRIKGDRASSFDVAVDEVIDAAILAACNGARRYVWQWLRDFDDDDEENQ